MDCGGFCSCRAETQISAVIFDLDGTTLNTEKATKDVLKDFLAKYGKVLDKEKEDNRLGKMHKESAASIVKDYELPLTADEFSKEIIPYYQERWPQAKALPGANRLIRHLHKHGVPFALASNSLRKHVEGKISHQEGWEELFSVILGGDEVNSGKPSPDIFLEAAKRMGADAVHCLVIEDSVVGVTAAKAAGMKVVAVPSLPTQTHRYSTANSVLHSLLEFQPEIWGLPPFEDWVQNALPIEHLFVEGIVSKGDPRDGCTFLSITADESSSESLPDQVSGVYFGWARLGTHGIFKVVVAIGWDPHSDIATTIIQPCLIGEFNEYISGEQLQLLIVGYIRQLSIEENNLGGFDTIEKDKSIADGALDLPMFSNTMSSPLLAESTCRGSGCCE
ncbi:bifunctional riboflavin kinase/FMN phosphatase-like [Tasmannia lanceolata]|uniref:bifunctional riboflavin kinase/FMN phosphatase-like n=1 Tax=Tasmannia lanceolata TaxID=3420 RepID=UPI004062CD15